MQRQLHLKGTALLWAESLLETRTEAQLLSTGLLFSPFLGPVLCSDLTHGQKRCSVAGSFPSRNKSIEKRGVLSSKSIKSGH